MVLDGHGMGQNGQTVLEKVYMGILRKMPQNRFKIFFSLNVTLIDVIVSQIRSFGEGTSGLAVFV